jgi:hypothetical protein
MLALLLKAFNNNVLDCNLGNFIDLRKFDEGDTIRWWCNSDEMSKDLQSRTFIFINCSSQQLNHTSLLLQIF